MDEDYYLTQDVEIDVLPADSVISIGDTVNINFYTAVLKEELQRTPVEQMQIGISTIWFNQNFNSPADDKVIYQPLTSNISNEYGGYYLNILSYEDAQLNLVFNIEGYYLIDFEFYGSHHTKARNHCKDLIRTNYQTNLIINEGATNMQYNTILNNTAGYHGYDGSSGSFFIKVE